MSTTTHIARILRVGLATTSALVALACNDAAPDRSPSAPDDAVDEPGRNGASAPATSDFDFWGEAPPRAERLAMFDLFWRDLVQRYGAFVSSDRDLETMREELRPQVAAATTHGELYRLLSGVFGELRDVHNVFHSERVCESAVHDRPPVAWVGPFSRMASEQLGICVTALEDGTALVYDAAADNPAGLTPGDVIVGYDGEPLEAVVDQLRAMPLCGAHATQDVAEEHQLTEAAAVNFHLHETMNLRRSGDAEVASIATDELFLYEGEGTVCTGQLDVGIDKPWTTWDGLDKEAPVTWGVLPESNIGYLYVYAWTADAGALFVEAVHDLWETEGLIVDFRFNLGGDVRASFDGLAQLHDEDITDLFHVGVRASATDEEALEVVSRPYGVRVDPNTFYDRPIAVLVGPQAGSAGDVVPLYVAHHPRARRFGLPTIGSACFDPAQGTVWDPDPIVGDFTVRRTTCVGLDAEGAPIADGAIEPEETVWLRPQDVADGRDTVVERAVQWIGNEMM